MVYVMLWFMLWFMLCYGLGYGLCCEVVVSDTLVVVCIVDVDVSSSDVVDDVLTKYVVVSLFDVVVSSWEVVVSDTLVVICIVGRLQ